MSRIQGGGKDYAFNSWNTNYVNKISKCGWKCTSCNSSAWFSKKNILLVKQAAEYAQNLHRKVKNKDRTEKKSLDNDLLGRTAYYQGQVEEETYSESNFKIDDYRGKILDLRL